MLRLFFLFLSLLPMQLMANRLADAYIAEYKEIAISEMQRTGIPASIKLAQGLLESDWGRSGLAVEGKNHFGIKCGDNWNGPGYYHYDDDKDHMGELIKSCFRVYDSVYESYVAHSDFLTDQNKKHRYGFLFQEKTSDYKAWAHGLKKAGYATDPHYPSKLISIIEQYELYDFDQNIETSPYLAESESKNQKDSNKRNIETINHTKGIRRINGASYVVAGEGDTPMRISEQYGCSVKSVISFNEAIAYSRQSLKEGEIVFLQQKKKEFNGALKEHKVKRGQSMYDIAQKYGVELNSLYAQNRMPEEAEPMTGESIRLKGYVQWGKRPDFFVANSNPDEEEFLFDGEDIKHPQRYVEK